MNLLKRVLTTTGLILNGLAVIALLLAYLAVFIPPDKFWHPAFLGLIYPYLLLLNVVFILFWIFVKPKYVWISICFIALGYFQLNKFIQFKGEKTNSSETIKVLSYNSHGFKPETQDKNLNRSLKEMIEFISDQQADIICIQENKIRRNGKNNPLEINNLKKTLSKGQKLNVFMPRKTHNYAIYTKYKIKDSGEIHFENSLNMTIWVDLKTEHGMLRVYSCHFQSNQIKPDNYKIIEQPNLKIENNTIKEVKDLGFKLRENFIKRAAQVRLVKSHMKKSPYPVLVCGDFNDTPISYAYWKISDGLKDAFVESGVGISNTYRGKLPSLRIDYILSDSRFNIYNYKRHWVRYSDHYPITCDIIIPEKKSE